MAGSFNVEARGKTQYLSHGITIPVKYTLGAGSPVSNQPVNNAMLGLDPLVFYTILGVVIAGVAGSGVFLGRSRFLRK